MGSSDESLTSPRSADAGGFLTRIRRGVATIATRGLLQPARGVFAAYWADDLLGLGAEMAYNYPFALFPFFMFLSALLGFVGDHVGHADLFTLVMRFIAMLGPQAVQDLVRDWVHSVVYTRSPGLLTISAGFALFGATAGISVLAKGLFLVLTILYVVLPNAGVGLAPAAAGALFATLAWVAITRGFGVYLQYLGQFSGTYGGFATAIVLMVWMYGVSTVLLLGGELSAVLAGRRQSG